MGIRGVENARSGQIAQVLLVLFDLTVAPRQIERDLRHVMDVAVSDVPNRDPVGRALLLQALKCFKCRSLAAGGQAGVLHPELLGETKIILGWVCRHLERNFYARGERRKSSGGCGSERTSCYLCGHGCERGRDEGGGCRGQRGSG